MPSTIRALAVPILLLSVACEEGTVCERAASVDQPSIEVGLGYDGFDQVIEDGDVLTPDWGSQGGRHLPIAVRTAGLNPGSNRALAAPVDVPAFHIELIGVATGSVLADQLMAYEAMEGDEFEAELALGEVFIHGMEDSESTDADGEDYLLRITAEDACGTVLTRELQVTVAP